MLGPLFELAEHSQELTGTMAGTFSAQERRYGIPRFVFEGPKAEHDPIRLGLFAGVHGDEPAGCAALVRLLCDLVNDPAKAAGYDLVVYPVCNPTGFEDGTRTNRGGLDLNREFWRGSTQPEVVILESELRAHRFDGIITLHADDTIPPESSEVIVSVVLAVVFGGIGSFIAWRTAIVQARDDQPEPSRPLPGFENGPGQDTW